MTQDTSREAVESLICGPLTEIARSLGIAVTEDDAETCKAVAATLRALLDERDELRTCAGLRMDLANHHNAARCPYCNSDMQRQADSIAALTAENAALRAQVEADDALMRAVQSLTGDIWSTPIPNALAACRNARKATRTKGTDNAG